MSFQELFPIETLVPNQYVRAFLVFVILSFILRVILLVSERVFLKFTRKTKTDVDDIIIEKSSKPITVVAILVSLIVSIQELTLAEGVKLVVNKTTFSLITIAIGYVLFVIIDIAIIRVWKRFAIKTKTEMDDSLVHLAHSAVKTAFIIFVGLYILNLWGIEIGPFLAGLGIAGLAIALALQQTLSNIFGGISLIVDQAFKVGDVIKLESGEMGIVHKIGLRTTRIRTFDNEMIIVPNSILANSRIQNFHQPDLSIRVNVEFGTEYGTDPEYIKKIVIDEISKIKFIDKNQEIRVLFTAMGDNALLFKSMFWVDNLSKKWPAHQEAITRIYRRLYKENIGIPFPQRTVWLRDEGKASQHTPFDSKYKDVKDKYFANFGHEYKEDNKKKELNTQKDEKKKSLYKHILKKFQKKKK